MTVFSLQDLRLLPPPDMVETLTFAQIRDELLAELPALRVSDPAFKLVEVFAYRELRLRHIINDGMRACLLATAAGEHLDHIGQGLHMFRRLIEPGDPEATPPVPPVYESDEEYRSRIELGPTGFAVAGPTRAYAALALEAHADVKDVAVLAADEVTVEVYVISRSGDGTPSSELLNAVAIALDHESALPLETVATVKPVSILPHSVSAHLRLLGDRDHAELMAAAKARLLQHLASRHAPGRELTTASIIEALMLPGVHDVQLSAPLVNLSPTETEAIYVAESSLSLSYEVHHGR